MSQTPNPQISYSCVAPDTAPADLCALFAARLAARFESYDVRPQQNAETGALPATLQVLTLTPNRMEAQLHWLSADGPWSSPPMGTLSSGFALPEDKLIRFLDSLIAQIPTP
ncbi:hypothetical protein [Cognatishimia maritima]|nr:hypothetical protein [Cognatishimia maritima]